MAGSTLGRCTAGVHALAAVLWLLAAHGSPSRAGAISTERTPACDVRLTGEIEPGDAKKLVAALKAVDTRRAPGRRLRTEQEIEGDKFLPRLCLDSPGGSYEEALLFIGAVMTKLSFATVVEKGATCYSACALAFMMGHHNQGDGYVELYRRMHVQAEVGFHAPFIPAVGRTDDRKLLDRSYREGVLAVADLLNLDQRFFPRSLLAEFLKVGPDQFFRITEVRQLAAWDIGIFGHRRANAVTVGGIERACTHHQLRNDSVYYPRFFPQWTGAVEEPDTPALRKPIAVGGQIARHAVENVGAEGAQTCRALMQVLGGRLIVSVHVDAPDAQHIRDNGKRRVFVSEKVDTDPAGVDPDSYTPAHFMLPGRTRLLDLPREGG